MCAPVVSGDGLHALYQAYDGSDKEHEDAVDNAVGSYGHVAAVVT